MKAQRPAEGILKTNDFGNSMWYKVTCSCGQPYHAHDINVEADSTGVSVDIYTTVKTDYWTETVEKRYDIDNEILQEVDWKWKDIINGLVRRIKLTLEIWITGAVSVETTIHMSEQQALNYAETLKAALDVVKEYKKS